MPRLWSGAMDNGCHSGADDDGWWRKGALWMEMGDRKRGFERIEEEAKTLKWGTKLLKRKMNFAQGKMVCEIFAYLWFSKTESMVFENWRKKQIRTRFAQGSHTCEIRTGDREHVIFEKWNSHRVNGVRNFRTPQGGVRILLSLVLSPLFSLVFTKTSFFKSSYLHVSTKNTIQTTLEWN